VHVERFNYESNASIQKIGVTDKLNGVRYSEHIFSVGYHKHAFQYYGM
jgi:hypothetical protein